MFQVTALDAEGAIAAFVRYAKGMIVDLTMLIASLRFMFVAWNVPDHATHVAVAKKAGPSCSQRCVLSLQKYQPQVLRAQHTQWQSSHLVLEMCAVSRVNGSVPRKSRLRHFHVIAHEARDPCSEADLSFGQEREIDGV